LASGEVRVERYFYDGVRRISEVVTDPMESVALALTGEAGSQAQGEAQQAVSEEEDLETEGLTVGVQQAQSGSGANPNTPVGGQHLAREYIWGPGDAGLDELLVQFDASRSASWPVHDAGGDLVALLDTNGTAASGTTTARVIGEWTYDPYGNVVIRLIARSGCPASIRSSTWNVWQTAAWRSGVPFIPNCSRHHPPRLRPWGQFFNSLLGNRAISIILHIISKGAQNGVDKRYPSPENVPETHPAGCERDWST
jgi:hypothetical protein